MLKISLLTIPMRLDEDRGHHGDYSKHVYRKRVDRDDENQYTRTAQQDNCALLIYTSVLSRQTRELSRSFVRRLFAAKSEVGALPERELAARIFIKDKLQ